MIWHRHLAPTIWVFHLGFSLGIVVVPKEQYFEESFLSVKLEQLYGRGWPEWNITLDAPRPNDTKTDSLRDLIRHLRNAAGHGSLTYTGDPDSRHMREVRIRIEDKYPGDSEFNWRSEIGAEDLYQFCLRFTEYIDESIG